MMDWTFVAEVNQGPAQVANLQLLIQNEKNIVDLVEKDIRIGTENLIRIVAAADGLQQTNEELATERHFSNTLLKSITC